MVFKKFYIFKIVFYIYCGFDFTFRDGESSEEELEARRVLNKDIPRDFDSQRRCCNIVIATINAKNLTKFNIAERACIECRIFTSKLEDEKNHICRLKDNLEREKAAAAEARAADESKAAATKCKNKATQSLITATQALEAINMDQKFIDEFLSKCGCLSVKELEEVLDKMFSS